jgi:hypothetical protein
MIQPPVYLQITRVCGQVKCATTLSKLLFACLDHESRTRRGYDRTHALASAGGMRLDAAV